MIILQKEINEHYKLNRKKESVHLITYVSNMKLKTSENVDPICFYSGCLNELIISTNLQMVIWGFLQFQSQIFGNFIEKLKRIQII